MPLHLSPDAAQILKALDASRLRSEPFIERLKDLGFEPELPLRGLLRFKGASGIVACLPGPEGTIATCVCFDQGYWFTVGTAILMYSAVSMNDARLAAIGVVLAAAGVSRSGLSVPDNLVRMLREEAQASAQRSVRDRIMDVVAGQCHLTDVAETTRLEDFCDALDMVEIVLSLEEIYGTAITGLEDWEPFVPSSVTTVGDLAALVGPQVT